MTISYKTRIGIHAAPDRVWRILTDAAGYRDWCTPVARIEGRIAAGEAITLHSIGRKGRKFKLNVSQVEPPVRMVWTGGMPFGLFGGAREFRLTAEGTRTLFEMEETFSGVLTPFFERVMPDLQPAFDRFAADLKRAAEDGAGSEIS